jgi:hypothetical protein
MRKFALARVMVMVMHDQKFFAFAQPQFNLKIEINNFNSYLYFRWL